MQNKGPDAEHTHITPAAKKKHNHQQGQTSWQLAKLAVTMISQPI